jgi:MFS family permease
MKSVRAYAWYVACVLAVGQIMASLDRYVMSVVLEPVKHDLFISDSQLGLLSGTSFALVFCLASIPLGRLVDVMNRRWIVASGIFFWSASTLACAFAHSFWGLFVGRLGIGLGEAALLPGAVSLIAAYFGKAQMTKGLVVFMMGNPLGRAVAFLGGGALFALLVSQGGLPLARLGVFRPWQGVFLISGLIGIAVSILCLTIREPTRTPTAGGTTHRMADTIAYFLRHIGVYTRVFLVCGIDVAIASAMATWSVSLFVRKYGMAVGKASMIIGAISLVAGSISTLFGGWLTDQMIRRNVKAAPMVVAAGLIAACPVVGLVLWLSNSLLLTFAGYTVIYFAFNAGVPVCLMGVQLVTPDKHRGVISSFYLVTYSLLGLGGGPLLVGLSNDYLFQSPAAVGSSLALTFFALSLIGVPLALSGRNAYQSAAANVHHFE